MHARVRVHVRVCVWGALVCGVCARMCCLYMCSVCACVCGVYVGMCVVGVWYCMYVWCVHACV